MELSSSASRPRTKRHSGRKDSASLFSLRSKLVAALVCCICLAGQAQRQIYGLALDQPLPETNPAYPFGALFRVDGQALNPEMLVAFDTTANRMPVDLTIASNGKIYGVARGSQAENTGQIIAYDPVTDSLMVVYDFDAQPLPWMLTGSSSLVEGAPGVLYGTGYSPYINAPANVETPIFSYRIEPDTVLHEGTVPGFQAGFNWYAQRLNGALSVLPNGRLLLAQGPDDNNSGAFGLLDTLANAYTTPWTIIFDVASGIDPNGDMVEYNGKWYSTTRGGGIGYDPGLDEGNGVIYAYDPVANTYEALYHFLDDASGRKPGPGLTKAANGLMYGLTTRGSQYGTTYYSTMYLFDPTTEQYTHMLDFLQTPLNYQTGPANPELLLASTNGKLYGAFQRGMWEFDPVLDTLRYRSNLNTGHGAMQVLSLVELCRKPNYKPRSTTSFNVCTGSHFFFDLRNVNATGVAWRRNGTIVPSQTSQLLEFAAIAEGDEGVWECTLTNECGVTVPPAITITVNAGAFATSTISGDTLLCGQGDSELLTGNNGGTWSNGSTAPSRTISQPGSYFVYNTQACGISMSNAVQVMQLDSAVAPFVQPLGGGIYSGDYAMCPGYPFTMGGNDNGPWGDLVPGVWQNGSSTPTYTVVDTGLVYVSCTNACNSDTSNILHMVITPAPPIPTPTLTDAFGQPADLFLCGDDSAMILLNSEANFYAYLNGEFLTSLGSFPFTPPFALDSLGVLEIISTGCPGLSADTLVLVIYQDTTAPPPPTILPDQPTLVGCDQDTAYLSATAPSCIWIWVDDLGFPQQDTTDVLQVDWSIGNSGVYQMVNYNGCGSSEPDYIQVVGTPAPDVLYAQPEDTLCLSDGVQPLSAGSPAGGTYSGPGVSGTTFSPQDAGIGEHTITYSYNDGTCTGYAQDMVFVDACLGIALTQAPAIDVSLVPNPNNGMFSLLIKGPVDHGSAGLYNALGKRAGPVVPVKIGANELRYPGLAAGVYTLRLRLDGRVRSVPFVVVE